MQFIVISASIMPTGSMFTGYEDSVSSSRYRSVKMQMVVMPHQSQSEAKDLPQVLEIHDFVLVFDEHR